MARSEEICSLDFAPIPNPIVGIIELAPSTIRICFNQMIPSTCCIRSVLPSLCPVCPSFLSVCPLCNNQPGNLGKSWPCVSALQRATAVHFNSPLSKLSLLSIPALICFSWTWIAFLCLSQPIAKLFVVVDSAQHARFSVFTTNKNVSLFDPVGC